MPTCEKEYSLTITSFPEPTSYYKLDELGCASNCAIDEVGTLDLVQGGIGSASIVAGKIGNCFQMNATVRYELNSAVLVPGPSSFTFRYWFQFPTAGALSGTTFLISGGGGTYLEIHNGSSPYKMFVDLNTDDGLFSIETVAGQIPSATWHRLVVTYDHDQTLRLRLNDNSDITIPATGDLLVGGSNLFRIAGVDTVFLMDEVYYLKGGVWTESELDLDWNSGNGRTYPF